MSRSTRQPHDPAASAPAPEAVREGDPAPTPREGREANGRFGNGNRGGPGNPFARQTAALRKQLLASVTQEDMEAICRMLILRARGGSVPHVKLLFGYIIGKPGDVVDPDTLDLQEMEQYRRELGMAELACKAGRALAPGGGLRRRAGGPAPCRRTLLRRPGGPAPRRDALRARRGPPRDGGGPGGPGRCPVTKRCKRRGRGAVTKRR